MFIKEMYIAKRCYSKQIKAEIVSAGHSCRFIRYVFGVFPDSPEIFYVPNGYENDIMLWKECKNINGIIAKAKEELAEDEQILFQMLYNNETECLIDFEFCGYDLLEAGTSAINDCDFEISGLNDFGLIPQLNKAIEVNNELRINFPFEQHAHCDIYAVWRYINKVQKNNKN